MNYFRFPAPAERARRGGAVFKGRCSKINEPLNSKLEIVLRRGQIV